MRYLSATFRLSGEHLLPEMKETALDLVAGLCGDAGFESFETAGDTLVGYVQDDLLDRALLDELLAAFPMPGVTVDYELQEAEYKDWNAAWEAEGFEPIVVGDRCVIHDLRHLPEPVADGVMEVAIDARMAFGSGTHDTTRMMVEQLLSMELGGLRVLDCGCGTGILSIVASKCGAGGVVAYDIDEWSVENTRHNAVLNGVDNSIMARARAKGLIDVEAVNIRDYTLEKHGRVDDYTYGGGAGLLSDVKDYITFVDTLACNGVSRQGVRILSPEMIQLWSANQLAAKSRQTFDQWNRKGYSYALGVRTRVEADLGGKGQVGEFGWDGAASAWNMVDPVNHVSAYFAMHVRNYGYSYDVIHPKIRDLIYRGLEA